MGASKESGGAQRRIILSLIMCLHLVTSQHLGDEAAEAPPCPPELQYSSLNSTEILDALTCTTLPPPHDGGDLSPVADMTSDPEPTRTATFAEVVLTALSASRKEEGTTQWEILFKLLFPAAVCALLFCEFPLRNLCPRYAHIIKKQLLIISVNALMAILLPAELFWVPALCFAASLLTFIIAP